MAAENLFDWREKVRRGKPKSPHWPILVKFLHWTIALVLVVEVGVGFVMSQTFAASFSDKTIGELHQTSSQIHHTVGIFIMLGAWVWLFSRPWLGRPPMIVMPVWQRALSHTVHLLLLLLLIAIPWTGWTALSALADTQEYGATHMWLFGSDWALPRIWTALPPEDPAGYSQFARWHRGLLWLGAGAIALHVLAAGWHHWVRRDQALRRIWPLTEPGSMQVDPQVEESSVDS